jgi:hypothetical protein
MEHVPLPGFRGKILNCIKKEGNVPKLVKSITIKQCYSSILSMNAFHNFLHKSGINATAVVYFPIR